MTKKYVGVFGLVLWAGCGVAFAATGEAIIKGTKEGSVVAGKAVLTDTPDGLKISVELANVSPGKHAFHIHENGGCGDEGKAAGGHYNPDGTPHGLVTKDGFEHAHAGDFGNIEVGPDGMGKFETVVNGLTLTGGKRNVEGRAFIVHEKEDDFGQPTGNAGGRIGCGEIKVTG